MTNNPYDLANIENLAHLWEELGAEPPAPVTGARLSISWPHRLWLAPDAPPDGDTARALVESAERHARPLLIPDWYGPRSALAQVLSAHAGLIYPEGPIAGLHLLGVVPEQRGRGIAQVLMEALLERSAELNCTLGVLQASAMGAPLYVRVGFRARGPLRTWKRAASCPRQAVSVR